MESKTAWDLRIHPAANLFPLMGDQDYEALRDDIKAQGLEHPIMLYRGEVLDGRNRLRACRELAIPPRYVDYGGADPFGYVVSANLRRRSLNKTAASIAAARFADLRWGGDRRKPSGPTHSDAARLFGISKRLVEKASAFLNVANKGQVSDDVVQKVARGEMSIDRAMVISGLSGSRKPKGLKKRGNSEDWANRFGPRLHSEVEAFRHHLDALLNDAKKAKELTPERFNQWNEACDTIGRLLREIGVRNPIPADESVGFEEEVNDPGSIKSQSQTKRPSRGGRWRIQIVKTPRAD